MRKSDIIISMLSCFYSLIKSNFGPQRREFYMESAVLKNKEILQKLLPIVERPFEFIIQEIQEPQGGSETSGSANRVKIVKFRSGSWTNTLKPSLQHNMAVI